MNHQQDMQIINGKLKTYKRMDNEYEEEAPTQATPWHGPKRHR